MLRPAALGHSRSAGNRSGCSRASEACQQYTGQQYAGHPYGEQQYDERYRDQPAAAAAPPSYPLPAPQQYPQVEYGREHVSEYRRGPEPVAGYPYPEAELPLPRRTVPPSMARPGMTVLPSQPGQPGAGASGRRRARDAEAEPFLDTSARELTWEEQQGQRDDGQYRPY